MTALNRTYFAWIMMRLMFRFLFVWVILSTMKTVYLSIAFPPFPMIGSVMGVIPQYH